MDRSDPSVPPTDAFGLLADETRLGIIQALAEHQRSSEESPHLSFSELRRAVGITDAGKFNYHLDKLCDHFVTKTDDGYRLRTAGLLVVSAVASGMYNEQTTREEAEMDFECPLCSRSLIAGYDADMFRMNCVAHGTIARLPVPPGATKGRSIEEIGRLAAIQSMQFVQSATHGVCPLCWGTVETMLEPEPTGQPTYAVDCTSCSNSFQTSAGMVVIDHPAVTSFLYERGMQPTADRLFEARFVWHPRAAEITSTDPVMVTVSIERDDDELEVDLDEHAQVQEVRSPSLL